MLIFGEFFKTQTLQNIDQSAPNYCILYFQNFLEGASIYTSEPPPPTYTCNYD